MEEKLSGNMTMRPRARLISILGDELISDEAVAVVELVKNAFDADAKKVDVIFENNDEGIAERLIIKDTGHGMPLETVKLGWFEPGTILKKAKQKSPKGRTYQGAKGIGRFASARLGEFLILETSPEGENNQTTVIFEWVNFNNDDAYLDQVQITYDTVSVEKPRIGTTLTIEGLNKRKIWEEEDYKNLHDRLSRLISPFDEVKDFEIHLDIPSHSEFTGEVEPHPLIKKPLYKFSGVLAEDGLVSGKIEYDGKILKKYKSHSVAGKGETVQCGSYEFEIRGWDRDRIALSPYMVDYDKTLTDIRKILDSYCGVSIYRDGFRVYPYGEKGNDWLKLDNRSRQNPTTHMANNQIIASLKISRETNPELKDRANREGMVHNFQFKQLEEWFIRILHILEEERYSKRPREDGKPEYTATLFEAFDMSEVVITTDKQLGKKHPITKLVVNKDKEIREGVKKLQEHYSRILMAAGLGQLVDLVIHEIGAPLGRINRELNSIIKKLDLSEEMEKSFGDIKGWLELIGNLRQMLDPKTAGKRGRATSFNVADEILGNLNLFENLINKQKVNVKFIEPKEKMIVHMARSVTGQIIANLLDNSIFWLTRHHGDGEGGNIEIKIENLDKGFRLIFSDDGPNINGEDIERIFDQYFSKKPNGMGLGLFIARQIIEPYGKIVYRDDCDLSGACFEIDFVKNVGL